MRDMGTMRDMGSLFIEITYYYYSTTSSMLMARE